MAAVGLRQGFSVFVAGRRQVPKVRSARADMARTALVSALGLMKTFVCFQQSFSRHGIARASAALPIWLSENVGLSFEQVGREAIRPGCPTLGSEIHAVVHSSGFVFFESFRFGCLRPFFRLGIARISLGFAFGLTKTLLMLTKINKEFVCCNTYRKKKIIFYLFRSRVFGFDRKRNSSGAARAVAGNAEK